MKVYEILKIFVHKNMNDCFFYIIVKFLLAFLSIINENVDTFFKNCFLYICFIPLKFILESLNMIWIIYIINFPEVYYLNEKHRILCITRVGSVLFRQIRTFQCIKLTFQIFSCNLRIFETWHFFSIETQKS